MLVQMVRKSQKEDQGCARIVRGETADLGDLVSAHSLARLTAHGQFYRIIQILLEEQGFLRSAPESDRCQHTTGLVPKGNDVGIMSPDLAAERLTISLIKKPFGLDPVWTGLLVKGD